MAETFDFFGTALLIIISALMILSAIARAKAEIMDAVDRAGDKPLATKEGRDG